MLIVAWLEVEERDQPYPQSWSPWLREKLLSVHCFGRMYLTDVGLARFPVPDGDLEFGQRDA